MHLLAYCDSNACCSILWQLQSEKKRLSIFFQFPSLCEKIKLQLIDWWAFTTYSLLNSSRRIVFVVVRDLFAQQFRLTLVREWRFRMLEVLMAVVQSI